jgi:hypothetical protein
MKKLLIAAAFAASFANVAHADDMSSAYINAPKNYGMYGNSDGTSYDANTGATYGADMSAPDYDANYRTGYDSYGNAYSYGR